MGRVCWLRLERWAGVGGACIGQGVVAGALVGRTGSRRKADGDLWHGVGGKWYHLARTEKVVGGTAEDAEGGG